MPKTKGTLRLNRFQVIATMLNSNDSVSINYAAAYLAYFQDTWAGAYPNIANDPGVLGTLYNNGPYVPGTNILTPPHSNPKPSLEFGVPVQQYYNTMAYLLGV